MSETTKKEAWAAKQADAVVLAIDRIAKAYAIGDEVAVQKWRVELWADLNRLILELDSRVHL